MAGFSLVVAGCRTWVPMGSYGFLWVPMGSYGFLWVPLGSFGFLWVPMGSYGFLWVPSLGTWGEVSGPRSGIVCVCSCVWWGARGCDG